VIAMNPFLNKLPIPAAVLALATAPGCSSGPNPPVCSAPRGGDAAAQALAAEDAAFAVSFFPPAAQAVGGGKNVILSPYGVSALLTMVDVGAAGQTETQIESTLSLPASGTAVAPAFAALACDDETNGSSDDNQLSIGNGLWAQKGMSLKPAFVSTLAQGYAAPLQQADFAADAAGSASTINQWVSTQTDGAIPTLFNPGDIDPSTRLVLVNAIYFKGAWANGFDPSLTRPAPFTLEDGSQVMVTTMSGQVVVSQGQGTGFSVFEIPYKGGAMAMDILLPDHQLSALEGSLTQEALSAALSSLGPQSQISVSLPKFSFTTRLDLIPVLSGLGIKDLFDPTKSDLSGIDGAQDLYVNVVVQQAMIEVDEEGTVAAAATGGVVETSGAAEGVTIDHPFLFLLRDTKTGSVIFMGHVEDPRAGS
jgi:serpin B